jgi:hypothetical protein
MSKLIRHLLGAGFLMWILGGQWVLAEPDTLVVPDLNITTTQGTPVTFNVLPDDDDDYTLIEFGLPDHGAADDNGDGTITYSPNPDFSGTDPFTYTLRKGKPGKPKGKGKDQERDKKHYGTGTITVTVLSANDPPAAVDDAATTEEDTPAEIAVLANDSDPDGDPLSLQSVTQGANGSVELNPNGTVTYTPAADFNGSDSFEYTISDGNGGTASATVSATVTPVNDTPQADDQSVATAEDTGVAVTLTGSDVDDDPLSFQVISDPAHGQLTGTAPALTYTPDPDFNGTDSFTFRVSDGDLADDGTVSISVGAANDPPIAADDAASTDEDVPVTVAVLANDSDPDGDPLAIQSVTQGANGSTAINPDGTVTYSPTADFNGSDSFTYTISDGNSGSDQAAVAITVNAVNDDPVAADDHAGTPEDTPITLDVLANDFDVDGDDLTIQNVTQANGVVHINADGTLTYDPTPNFSGTDFFTYTVIDGNGGKASATVTLTVGAVNDPPIAVDDDATTAEDVRVTIAVLANDGDPENDDLSIESVTQGANGSAAINNPDGTVTYTPATDFNGSDSFDYTISDGNGGTASATVSVSVAPVNDAPIAEDQSVSTAEDAGVAVTLTGADVDDDPLSFQVISDPAHGQLTGTAPALTYTPDPDYNGSDSFTFQVSDGDLTDDGTVSISVGAANDPPVAAADAATTDEDFPVTITVLANDSDPDGDDLSLAGATDGTNGTAETNPDGTVTYTPHADFHGSDSFTYTISDGNGATAEGTVAVTVTPVNDNPVANDDQGTTPEDTPIILDVLANDFDVDGDDLTVQNVNQHNGVVHVNPDSTLTYDPTPNFSGTDFFTYTIVDGNGGKATATVTLTVESENDPPIAADDDTTTNEDVSVTIAVLANDSDPDDDELNVDSVTQGANGSTAFNPAGTVTYTPAADFNGSDSFDYTISDGNGGTASATVSVTVVPVNDAPLADDQSVSTDEDTEVAVTLTGSSTVNPSPIRLSAAQPAASSPAQHPA